MPFNRNPMAWPPPDEVLEEPDRRLDDLVAFIRDRHEPGLAAWIVETLAGSLAVPIVVLPGAPVNRARDLAGLMVIALAEAARARPDSRRDIVQQTIVPHVEELLTLASEWRGQHNRLDWTGRPWASPARQ